MRILYYNWDIIDGHSGGGVTVYQKNLIDEMMKRSDIDIHYMNAGLRYDKKRTAG